MNTVQPHHFVRLPHSLLHHIKTGKLSPLDLTIYALIAEQIQHKEGFQATSAEMSTRYLASETQHQQKSIGISIKQLEEAGFLHIERKRGCAAVYTLTLPGGEKFSTGAVLKTAGVPSSRRHPPSFKERSIEKDTTARSAPPSPDSDEQIKKRMFGVASALMKRMPTASIADVSDELKYELIRQAIPYNHVNVNEVLNTLLARQAAVRRNGYQKKSP